MSLLRGAATSQSNVQFSVAAVTYHCGRRWLRDELWGQMPLHTKVLTTAAATTQRSRTASRAKSGDRQRRQRRPRETAHKKKCAATSTVASSRSASSQSGLHAYLHTHQLEALRPAPEVRDHHRLKPPRPPRSPSRIRVSKWGGRIRIGTVQAKPRKGQSDRQGLDVGSEICALAAAAAQRYRG